MQALVPLAIVAAVAGLVALAVHGYRQEQKRRAALAAFAGARGWTYTADDDQWVHRWTGTPFGSGTRPSASNILQGRFRDRQVVAFDYTYVTESTDSKGNRSTTTHRYAVHAMHTGAYFPTLQVTPENVLTRLGSRLGLGDLELESEDFNRRFRISCAEPKFAVDVLHPRTMQMMLQRPATSWRLEATDILSWSEGRLAPVQVLGALSHLADVLDGMPSYVWRDHGVEPPQITGGATA